MLFVHQLVLLCKYHCSIRYYTTSGGRQLSLSLWIPAVSLYVLDRNLYNKDPSSGQGDPNPYRRHRRVKDEEKVPAEIWNQYAGQILDLVLYDVEDCAALRNFAAVKNETPCIFAKRSTLWGARDYDKDLTLGTFERMRIMVLNHDLFFFSRTKRHKVSVIHKYTRKK